MGDDEGEELTKINAVEKLLDLAAVASTQRTALKKKQAADQRKEGKGTKRSRRDNPDENQSDRDLSQR